MRSSCENFFIFITLNNNLPHTLKPRFTMAGSGVNYDILANGLIDKFLTGNPTVTFFRAKWNRPTKFAIESLTQPFNTTTSFGTESQILLNRVGDMVYWTYLRVQLPGIVACDLSKEQCPGVASGGQFPTYMNDGGACNPSKAADEAALIEYLPSDFNDLTSEQQADALRDAKDVWRREKYGARRELSCCVEGNSDCPDVVCPELGDAWCHFCNDVGHFMINRAKLIIGGQQIDQLWGTFLFAWEELSGKSGRRLTELTGRRYTHSQLVCDSGEERMLYIPLPFFYTLASGSALPLASLAYHGVQINVEFAKIEELIVVSRSDIAVRNARTGLGITAADCKADLEVSYVYLDQAERDKFQSAHFEQIIVQTQHYYKTENKEICRIPLSFNHPALELIFGVRRQCQARCNNWGNLSGVDGRDPIVSAELLLNTTSRFGNKPALYWRGIQPLQHHSNLPEVFLYCMCFALSPENALEPTGSCNFSRIDNIELVLHMQSTLANENYGCFVFCRTWNLMRYREGVAGAAFQ